jgi:general secretion pathway protein A
MLGAGVSLKIHPVPRGPIVNEDFFGLRENPFSLTPNPRYIHRTRHAHETLGRITRGILDRKGLIQLTGDVGTGKTTLLYTALHLLDGNPAVQHKIKTAVIVHPTLTREEFLETILDEFDVHPSSHRRSARLEALLKMLLDVRRKGGLAVLVIDEAQMLTVELLKEIRALLELQTSPEKLLQVILCGQPAIEAKIDALNDGAGQLLEVVRCSAMPLTQDETRDYVQHRMRIAGALSDSIFLPEAVQRVHERSGGIPRLVNLLCAQGLSVAASRHTTRVTPRMIEDAAAKICAKAQSPRVRKSVAPDSVAPESLALESVAQDSVTADSVTLDSMATVSVALDIDAAFVETVATNATVDAGVDADAAKNIAVPSVSFRTARRQKRAARRARIADAARRAAQVDAQAIAERVRTGQDAMTQQANSAPFASASVAASVPVSPSAKLVQKNMARKASSALRGWASSIVAWNRTLNRWCSQQFKNKPRGKRLIQIGLAGILLLVVAEVIGQLAPSHLAHIAFGFMGMLFIDIALGLGLYLLLISRGLVGTRPAWAQSLLNSWSSLIRRSS